MFALTQTLGWFSQLVVISIDLDGPVGPDSGEEFVVPEDNFKGKILLVIWLSGSRRSLWIRYSDYVLKLLNARRRHQARFL